MLRITSLLPALCVLAACVAEPPTEAALPTPPPPPPRFHAQRAVPRPQPPVAGPEARVEPGQISAGATEAVWHVARDGVVGCADRAALDVLRQTAEGTPRLLAQARASGGCRTTFRVNEWALVGTEADAVRLRLTNGAPLTLWFLRGEVVAP